MPAPHGLSPLSKAFLMRRAFQRRMLPHSLAMALSLPLAGYVQAQEVEFDIPPQALGSALQEFGRQADIQVLYRPEEVRNKRSSAIKGKLEPNQAITELLRGTGASVDFQGNAITISVAEAADSSVDLGATMITSNQLGTITEDSGSYTPGTIATATRLVLTPRETPQSITVVTRQNMDDFGLNNIDDVMRHTPGITVSAYDTDRNNYYARGFSINNFQYDGIPSTARNVGYSAGNTLSDMAIYDRVEVLKGATGLLTGAGSLGATINLIRKKPTHEFKGHVELGAGSWDNYRSELDVSGPLTESGNVRGRAVAAYQDKHSFMDHYERKTSVYYGILEFDLNPDTMLTVGADYQDNDPKGSGWSGSFPLFDSQGNRNDVSRSFNNGAKWSSWEQYTRTVFANLEHNFANGWVGKVQLDHKINGYHAPLGAIMGDWPAPDNSAKIVAQKYTGETKSNSLDIYLTGPFQFLGREHELVVGTSASFSHWEGKSYWNLRNYDNTTDDFINWDGDIGKPDWGTPSQYIDDKTRQLGSYMTARFNVTDDLNLFLGGRVVDYRVTGLNPTIREYGRFIPYVGAVYDLNDTYSVYASYTDIFMPQDSWYRDSSNKLLEPDEGQNYEIGIKGEYLDGRLNTSLAYFEIHEENRAEEDALYNSKPTNPAITYAYKGIKAKTKGYEAEISGELAPGWQVQAGYTHKIIRDDSGKKVSTWEPQDQLSLYTSYKFKGALDKLTVGGGARWQGKSWQMVYNNPRSRWEKFSQEDYWLVDLMARYQITDKLSASVNVNNVFDKTYYTNIGFYTSASYGDPRNLMFSTRWDF
ncbi:ferripyoverdine/pyocin S3 receptor FpvA [Pseudomonas aeruginosa]|uniref:ferripyoverdine/pyocin S3 receptor FpvA n=1 Tax=Pseudomonas aeruginosa TaxID=287 RepID=UPI00162822BB|nr:ferripyoverdine/pyocin S3 receptor FpvA [Pseudomonas aeruginosa]MBX5852542.1 ferripyoverdine/pyocin S3 receptor FpvA [Pseudomonas aeruginosa]MCV3790315.1 ferripyoverdine/pyocin S3 receptor FpvA [Pseudomonas aeruginosa]QNE64834.1 TonB-dependent siderophore receptor [Pseudomonas aeruginosa]HEJ3638083.1 ferripyoverdine/pyocin S3 receptor FpvA [Pseudomonas aeruginosa]